MLVKLVRLSIRYKSRLDAGNLASSPNFGAVPRSRVYVLLFWSVYTTSRLYHSTRSGPQTISPFCQRFISEIKIVPSIHQLLKRFKRPEWIFGGNSRYLASSLMNPAGACPRYVLPTVSPSNSFPISAFRGIVWSAAAGGFRGSPM